MSLLCFKLSKISLLYLKSKSLILASKTLASFSSLLLYLPPFAHNFPTSLVSLLLKLAMSTSTSGPLCLLSLLPDYICWHSWLIIQVSNQITPLQTTPSPNSHHLEETPKSPSFAPLCLVFFMALFAMGSHLFIWWLAYCFSLPTSLSSGHCLVAAVSSATATVEQALNKHSIKACWMNEWMSLHER